MGGSAITESRLNCALRMLSSKIQPLGLWSDLVVTVRDMAPVYPGVFQVSVVMEFCGESLLLGSLRSMPSWSERRKIRNAFNGAGAYIRNTPAGQNRLQLVQTVFESCHADQASQRPGRQFYRAHMKFELFDGEPELPLVPWGSSCKAVEYLGSSLSF